LKTTGVSVYRQVTSRKIVVLSCLHTLHPAHYVDGAVWQGLAYRSYLRKHRQRVTFDWNLVSP